MSDELIGARLDNYEIESQLGQGGMARVYKARDIRLKRPAAIKMIDPGLSDQKKYRERFEREAQAVANLRHPNIVSVYYFGTWKRLYYLAMQFVEGQDLETLIRQYGDEGELVPHDDVLRIISDIAAALDYAHSQGVIHRDVKPGNILIDRDGTAYLSDFGLVLDLDKGTRGEILGSPHYTAPEQVRSSSNAVPQSDIYSLGITIYQLLTGHVPFNDPNPTALALKHLSETPPSPRQFNKKISPEVEAVILKAMAKNPEERYKNAKSLAAALRKAMASQEKPARAARNVAQRVQASQGTSSKTPLVMGKRRRSILPRLILLTLLIILVAAAVQYSGILNSTPVSPASVASSTDTVDGIALRFIYDDNGFFWINNSTQDLRPRMIAFRRVDGRREFFAGSRWEEFYEFVEDGACMLLLTPNGRLEDAPQPSECRRLNAYMRAADEVFWTGDSGQFSVWWNSEEVGVCEITAGSCSVVVPP